jgi:hypothetical protein
MLMVRSVGCRWTYGLSVGFSRRMLSSSATKCSDTIMNPHILIIAIFDAYLPLLGWYVPAYPDELWHSHTRLLPLTVTL